MKLKTKIKNITDTKSGYRVALSDGTQFSLLRRGRFLTARIMVQGRAVTFSTKRSEAADAAEYAAPVIARAIISRFEVVEQAQAKTIWPTVLELAERYINNGNHESTIFYRKKTVRWLKAILRAVIGHDDLARIRADQLTAKVLSDWKALRIAGKEGTKLMSAKRTANGGVSSVRAMFSRRLTEGDASPYAGLKLPPCLAEWRVVPKFGKVKVSNHVREARPIVEAKLAKVIELKETDPAAYLACCLAAQCGLRLGEIVNARKSWIIGDTLKVQPTDNWLPKSRQSREIPLPAELKADILFLSDDSDYILPGHCRKLSRRLRDRLTAWIKKDGDWPFKMGIHEFRRWAGAKVLTQTGSMEAAREFLGHSSVVITETHYAGLLETPKFEIKLPTARVA